MTVVTALLPQPNVSTKSGFGLPGWLTGVLIVFWCCAAAPVHAAAPATAAPPLQLVGAIRLPDVQGRLDHLAADAAGHRLFIAALGNNTVEVIDLRTGTSIRSIGGFREPQSVSYIPAAGRLIVSNGGDGSCRILDSDSFEEVGRVRYGADADNLRYDPGTGQVLVGYGDGSLAGFDATTGRRLWDVALGGHPESFQLESTGSRIFANVPALGRVSVVDRSTKRVAAAWGLDGCKSNFPMALDSADHVLFVGCRRPSTVIVLNTDSGTRMGSVAAPGDADDLYYDANRRRLYVSCGQGRLAVFDHTEPGRLKPLSEIPTAPGARTSLWVPEHDRLYVAVPRRGREPAEIRIYAAR